MLPKLSFSPKMDNNPTCRPGNETFDGNVAQRTPSLQNDHFSTLLFQASPALLSPCEADRLLEEGRGPEIALHFLYWSMKP